MKGLVAVVSDAVPDGCRSDSCSKEGCTLSVRTAADRRVLVDLDCPDLHIPHDRKRCDYVFVGEKNTKAKNTKAKNTKAWVAPIELKSGRFDAAKVIAQLQGGAETVEEKKWLPDDGAFQFVPVLAHGEAIHRRQLNEFRSRKVRLRKQKQQVAVLRCGGTLKDVLDDR